MTKQETRVQMPMQYHHHVDDEIELREIFATIWAGKWFIIAVTLIFAAVGVTYALYKPNVYQANVLLAPANEDGNMSGFRGQLGGLANLAGLSLVSGGSRQTLIAKEVLQSRAFLSYFVRRYDLAAPLLGTEGWNQKTKSWIYNPYIYNADTKQWLEDKTGKSQRPTDWDLVNTFKQNHLGISENKDNGMLVLTIKSQSPEASQQWAEWLVSDINSQMRKQDVAEAEARIAYLEEKLNETNVAGMQQVFYQLIESETRTVMLANAQQDYVFKIIDPAIIPQDKSEPKRLIIVVLATMLGGMLALSIVFFRAFIKSDGN